MKYIKKSIALATVIEKKLKTNDPQKIERIKDFLKGRMGAPIGIHTTGAPIIFSTVLSLLSFSIPLLSIWKAIFHWFNLPDYAVFAGIIPTALIYCMLIFPAMTLISRGYLQAIKFYIFLIYMTTALAVANFIYNVVLSFLDVTYNTGFLIGAVIGLICIIGSIKCLNTNIFTKTTAYYLHNRAWRKQIKILGNISLN